MRTIRSQIIKQIVASIGEGGFREFLRQPQPAFQDMLGADLLEHHPEELLRRLDDLDRPGIDDDLDERIVIDPFNGDPPSKRKDAETARLLAILDSLPMERGES